MIVIVPFFSGRLLVTSSRTRTTRTATVTNCPAGCWLILGEGYTSSASDQAKLDQQTAAKTAKIKAAKKAARK